MKIPMRVKLKRAVIASVTAVTVFLAVGAGAALADGAGDQVPIGVADGHQLVITPPIWTIITGLLLPFVITFITKASASKTLKAVVAIVVSAAAAVIERATQVDGSALITQGLLLDVGMVYGPQLLSYLGFYTHIGLKTKIAPDFGIG